MLLILCFCDSEGVINLEFIATVRPEMSTYLYVYVVNDQNGYCSIKSDLEVRVVCMQVLPLHQ